MIRRRAVLDADVLYPAGLRDLLLRLADRYLFTPLWSADIHAEWMRSLLADRPDLDAAVLERTRSVMDGHFPEAVVTGHRALVGDLDLPDPDDRHVLAAAIEGRADVIVTRNMRDFPADRLAPHALAAEHPDAFVAGLLESDPETVLAVVRGHRAALRNPPRSAGGHLAALERLGLPGTVSLLRAHADAI
ncbi:MAG: PIN domain-containing protein [Rhodospirillales bacterium]|nr:PIN domain-containing protein [Rhodospirillales bacterium]MDE0371065.1 PIN domain-containing protein [Rhodospirillales bacterium]MYE18613.1 PIN domain-containing protein [Rhodospirillales bacterium]